MHAHLPDQAGHLLRAAVRSTVFVEPRTACNTLGTRGEPRSHRYSALAVDEVLPRVGSQPKSLLYPENWIEPELRDDKTEIFRAFESDLLQSEITDDTARSAFRKYLDTMTDISQLDRREHGPGASRRR